jgi:multisubunit Na+/H+ antiporter MnhG subunit
VVALDAMGLQLMAVIALFSILMDIKYMIVVILLVGINPIAATALMSAPIIIKIIEILMMMVSIMFNHLTFEDVYSRAHAAGKASTLGAMSLLFGAFLYFIVKDGYTNV